LLVEAAINKSKASMAFAKMISTYSSNLANVMAFTISLNPDIEAKLRAKAKQQGRDVNALAAELLTQLIQWEQEDTEQAIAGIQHGLDDFAKGHSRDFQFFVTEQRQKYELPTDE
jgi:predicted transcriptional regulator